MHACIAHVTSMGAPTNYEELAASLCQAGPFDWLLKCSWQICAAVWRQAI